MWMQEPGVAAAQPPQMKATETEGAEAAQRSLVARHPRSLDSGSVMHLQRMAGNAVVSALLADGEQASPVFDVVGSGGGQPLDRSTKAEMEASFGQDFGDVRIHTGDKASESARSVQAQAYTVGHDIVFQDGTFSPGTSAGKRTLAHELTHVVQQRSGPVDGAPAAGGVSISHPSDRFEQAAEQAADRVVGGPSASGGPMRASDDAGSSIQRQAEPDASEPVIQRQEAPSEEEVPSEEE